MIFFPKIHDAFPILRDVSSIVLIFSHIPILSLDLGNVRIFYVKDFKREDFNIIIF